MSVTFTSGATVVTLPEPQMPGDSGEGDPRQAVGFSGGGVPKVATLGDPDSIFELEFRRVSDAQWVALLSFIKTTVNYSATAFTYTDPFTTAHANMRYLTGIRSWKQRRGTTWSGTLVLRKDLGV